MRTRTKVVFFSLLGVAALAIAALLAGIFVVQSDWFKNKVRERIVAVAEKATGGRVEIGRFNYNWRELTAEVVPFILHGKEPPSSPPFFRAEKIQIGLKIVSALKKQVDIASVIVERPQVFVTVAPDGSTNVPNPNVLRSNKNFPEQLLDLKVQRFALDDGWAEYNSHRIPLEIRGEHLQASLAYEAAGPRYIGQVSSTHVRAASPAVQLPVTFNFDSKLALERNSLQVLEATVAAESSKVTLRGSITDFSSPRGAFDVAASAPVSELKKAFQLPLESSGRFSFSGRATVESNPFQYKAEGKLTGRELAYAYNDVTIRDIGLASHLQITSSAINLPEIEVSALHGKFRGSARIANFKRLAVEGRVQDFSLKELADVNRRPTGQLNGTVNGSIILNSSLTRTGLADTTLEAHLDLTPGIGGVPVQGAVSVIYDQRAGKIQLPSAEVNLGSTHVTASGTLGETLTVHVDSKDLNDAMAAFPLFGENPPDKLPVALREGSVQFDGSLKGPLTNPRVSGKAEGGPVALDKQQFDHFVTVFDLDRSAADLRSFTAQQGKMRLDGQARLSLQDWRLEDASTVSALVSVRGGDLHTLAVQNGIDLPATGTLAATLHVMGSLDSPLVTGKVDIQNVTAYEEHFDTAQADITFTTTGLEISQGEARSGPARISLNGAYNHPAKDWKDGSLRFEVTSDGLTVAQFKHVQNFRDGLAGQMDLKASGTAKLVSGSVELTSLNGQLYLRNAVLDGRPYGDLELTASTRLPLLTLAARVNLGGIQIQGNGEWRMEGDYPGQARIEIPRVPFATLHDLAPGPHLRSELPFDGFLQGEATVTGALNKPSAMKADITLSSVQFSARPNLRPLAGAQAQDLVLRNAQPVQLQATTKSIDIRSANFVAKETTLDASGHVALDSTNPWDLGIKGRINLSILQIFNPDLLASGTSVVSAAVRGSFTEPQVEGRLELMNASLFLRDFPNGLDQANGLILFDRNRATVQTLSAVTGGGTVSFQSGSFIGFRGPALLYRVQATASNVRYRSPDGLSITADSTLSLTGTSENSVLSGSVTVIRAAFNPRTDVGALLAAMAKPLSVSSTTPNEYLRGVQFDVQMTSARSLEVETSLTSNIQADTNLRLRGTPDRPVMLGYINVNSGQIEFFGNKYTINRGEMNFYNPAKIEPIIDMDLETRVRGITVDISFAGPLNKLNFSYRSDPPLQANDIIALLAVGRTPSTAGPLASSQLNANSSPLATGSNALLGQAIAPVSGRLQKFFGVSHIKVDPQLTGVTTIPQARLTLEQQISADITLTYITNLAVTNQQIVRVEWDLNKKWSVVALRDENGAFSVDFQYRKRFK